MPIVHYCFSQHLNEILPPKKCGNGCRKRLKKCVCKRCTCRQEISVAKATLLVQEGEAQWVIIRKDPIAIKKICDMCLNDDILKRSCPNCGKTGNVEAVVLSPVRGEDIVMVSTGSGEPGSEMFRSVMSKQTPRVATIELSHIIRAYVNGYQEDQERIEEYGRMDSQFLKGLVVPYRPDPDEGRTIFTFGVDERS
jgi:hypothetical protein